MRRYLLVNPRSGTDSPTAEELPAAPRPSWGSTSTSWARRRISSSSRAGAEADVLGMAGGDGSLAAVADVALEQEVPFVCIPFGTRNHFARDLGLDRDDPIGALAAFDGEERRIDVGRVGERLFLNNVSLGLYARLVHRREHHRAAATRSPGCAPSCSPSATSAGTSASRSTASTSAPGSCSSPTTTTASSCSPRRARANRRGIAAPVRPARLPPHHVGRAERARAGDRLPAHPYPGRRRRRAGRAGDRAALPDRTAGATRARAACARVIGSGRSWRTRARRRPAAPPARTSAAPSRSSPARSTPPAGRASQVRDRTVRSSYGCIQMPKNSVGSISRPVSSRSSRRSASRGCSGSSTNPPGMSHSPAPGSSLLRPSRTPPVALDECLHARNGVRPDGVAATPPT